MALLTPCVMPWIDRLVKTLLPKEEGFFDLLERGADTAVKAADVMARLCGTEDLHARSALLTEMRDVEHAADGVIHEQGPPEQLLKAPTQPRTQAFLARHREFDF